MRFGAFGLRVFCALGLFTGAALAQQPTQQQRDDIRAACRSDFMAQCSGVSPGGIEAFNCLQQHNASLSAACKKAVSAINAKPKSTSAEPSAPAATQSDAATAGSAPADTAAPAAAAAAATPAPAPTPRPMPEFTPREELIILREACGPDFRSLCGTVPLGGGRGIACLREKLASASPTCQKVLTTGL